MDRKRFTVLAVLAMASGAAGGVISGKVLPGTTVHAYDGVKVERVIRAESFQVVDSTGDVRAELCVCPEGKPGLVLIDRGYKIRARFALLNDGLPGLEMTDRGGRTRARLNLSADGSPSFLLLDENGATRAVIRLPDRGDADLQVQDGTGRLVWSALKETAAVR
ncbi:MAG TPA: hypothetical protein VF853_04775 [Candidatus Deferrimicrobiaceae bacterium]